MNQQYSTSTLVLLFLFISGCSGSDSSDGSVQQETGTPESTSLESSEVLPAIELQGVLPFARELTVDIGPMLLEADYGNPYLEKVARDGSNILIRVTSNSVEVADNITSSERGYIRIDTESGDATWVFTKVNSNTAIVFDENNNAIVTVSPACLEGGFIDMVGESTINLDSLIPDDRCSGQLELSDDGSVLVFETFNRDTVVNGFLDIDARYFSYNLTSSLMYEFPDTPIVFEEQSLDPAIPLFSEFGARPFLSNNGSYVTSRQVWGFDDENIDSPLLIGSVLWSTQTNQWETRGLAAGNRDWCGGNPVDCTQLFQYLLSADGNVQYTQIPNGEEIDSNRFGFVHGSTIVRSLSSGSGEEPVAGLENALAFSVNRDGRLLSFYATEASGDLSTGLTIYDNSTGEYIPVESALPTCAPASGELSESSCQDISTNSYFSADGSHLLLASSEFPSESTSEYILELESGALYQVPPSYSAFQGTVSGDGSVFAVPSPESENVFLIAKR